MNVHEKIQKQTQTGKHYKKDKETQYKPIENSAHVYAKQKPVTHPFVNQQKLHPFIGISPKLTVSTPGDTYEQEADRVADEVLKMKETDIQTLEHPPALSMKSNTHEGTEIDSPLASQVQSLDQTERSYFEPKFGIDFGNVRIHTGTGDAELAGRLNARAFTYREHIVFGKGEYAPGTGEGKRLLAHELAHVGQKILLMRNEDKIVYRWSEHEHKAFGDLAAQMVMQHKESFKIGVGIGIKDEGFYVNKESYKEFLKIVDPLKEMLKKKLEKEYKFSEAGVGVAHDVYPNKEKKHMSFGDATMLGGDYFKTAENRKRSQMTVDLKQAQTVNPIDEGMNIKMYQVATTNINHFWPLAEVEWDTQYKITKDIARKAHHLYKEGKKDEANKRAEEALRYLGVAVHFLQDTFASGHQYPGALDRIASSTEAGAGYKGFSRKSYHDELCMLKNGLPMLYENGRRFHGDNKADALDFPVVIESYHALAEILAIIAGISSPAKNNPKPNPGPNVPAIMNDGEAAPIWARMIGHLEEGKLPSAREEAAKNGKPRKYTTSSEEAEYSAKDVIDKWSKSGGISKLNHKQTVRVCRALFKGDHADYQQGFLQMLKAQTDIVFLSVVNELTLIDIAKKVKGKEWNTFLFMCASKYPADKNLGAMQIAVEKNNDAARMLSNGVKRKSPAAKGHLSSKEWVGIIYTLLYGRCDRDDENAIINILIYLVKEKNEAKLVDSQIGRDTMASGVDGDERKEVKKIMKEGGVDWGWR